MVALHFSVLGRLEVRRDGEPVVITAPKQRALLSLLLLRANEPVHQDELIERLWRDRPPRTARASLQNQIHALRKVLGARVVERLPEGYVLRVEPGHLDADRFERLVEAARNRPPEERQAKLREALECWRGSPFAEIRHELFAEPEISRLDEKRLSAVEARLDADLELGRHVELVPELEELVARNPLHERVWAQLMLALYRAGRQADALAAYGRARHAFVDELGIAPGEVLRKLQRAILVQDPALDDPKQRLGATLERAAALLQRTPRERAQSLYEYGSALISAGERRQAASTLQAAERHALAAGDRGLQERARLVLSHLSLFTEGSSPLAHLASAERAARAFDELEDHAGVALALLHRAHMLRVMGRLDDAAEVARRGVDRATRARDSRTEAAWRRMLALCLAYGRTPVNEAIVMCEEHLEASCWGDEGPYGLFGALALLHAQAGRVDDARALSERETAALRRAGNTWGLVTGMATAGVAERAAGNLDEAANNLRTAYTLLESEGDRAFLPQVAGQLACVLALRREHSEARPLAWTARSAALPGDFLAEVLWRRALALVAAHDRQHDEALRLSDEALARTQRSEWLTFHGETLEEAAEVRRLAGDEAGAAGALREAVAVYERKANVSGTQRVLQHLDRTPAKTRNLSQQFE